MLKQQETFKLGERAPEAGRYFCAACDRQKIDSTIEVDEAQVFPFCATCKEAGRIEPDQLWLRVADREAWRNQQDTRWRELWKD